MEVKTYRLLSITHSHTGRALQYRTTGLMVSSILKGKRFKSECNHYRGITLLEAVGRMFGQAVAEHVDGIYLL